MKILLVEDHPFLADITCKLLREVHGHEVEHAANGMDAVAIASRFEPDLVLIDLNLPDMTGYDVAAKMREQPQSADSILVALTGIAGFIDHRRADAVGFDACFEKPLDFEILADIRRKSPR